MLSRTEIMKPLEGTWGAFKLGPHGSLDFEQPGPTGTGLGFMWFTEPWSEPTVLVIPGSFPGLHPQLSKHVVLKALPVPPLPAPAKAFHAGFQIINFLPAFACLK